MSVFRKKDKIYIVNKDEFETFEHFIERGNFIASQGITNEKEYDRAVLYSHIFINNKYLKCDYDDKIMEELEVMLDKC